MQMSKMKLALTALALVALLVTPSQSAPDQVCGEGEEYTSCGSACPDTCDTILLVNQANRPCTMNCVPGCFCKQGLVRDTSSRKCIETFHCKARDTVQEADGGALALNAPAKWLSSLALLLTLYAGRRLL